VDNADYIATVARAYLGAPPETSEEHCLSVALTIACTRLGLDRETLLEWMVRTAPVVRPDDGGNDGG
jgi:hypothetical protein